MIEFTVMAFGGFRRRSIRMGLDAKERKRNRLYNILSYSWL